MVGHGGSSASSYLADPTSPIPSHYASIVATSTLRVITVDANKIMVICWYFPWVLHGCWSLGWTWNITSEIQRWDANIVSIVKLLKDGIS